MFGQIMKPVCASIVALLVLFSASRASADYGTGGTSGTAALVSSDFTIYFDRDDDAGTPVQLNTTTEAPYYFNRARCECQETVRIRVQATSATITKLSALLLSKAGQGIGKLYIGTTGCLSTTPAERTTCTNLLAPTDDTVGFNLNEITTNGYFRSDPIPITRFFDPKTDSTSSCSSTTTSLTKTIYFWCDVGIDGNPDITDGPTLAVLLDATAPDAPTLSEPKGGNKAVTVQWTPSTVNPPSADTNFKGYVVYCANADGSAVFPGKHDDPPFSTAKTLCPTTAPSTSSYGAFSDLDKNFICSDVLTPTETSHRIKDLQNGLSYLVGVAAVDKSGNISPINNVLSAIPVPTVDFYTDYRDAGGAAEGGYCSLTRSPTRIGALAILGVVGLALVLRRRGRKGPPGMLVLAIGTGLLLSGQARAQAVYHDNSFPDDVPSEAWGGSPRNFAIEARFGLYTPNVDSEFSGPGVGPHEFIFGTSHRPMWQLEFDWELYQAFGTLSVGCVIGYFKENAKACNQADLLANNVCTRSGDNTSLRLIPFAALLVYRMDVMAERWKIPIVPYAKFGLNYTFWTVKDGNGDTPSYPSGGHGSGGTMGWQAAIGLSLRLDFLDQAGARGFDADVGVNHTYAFFELDYVDSSGLGQKNALHVGDSTWFAGLMFEF